MNYIAVDCETTLIPPSGKVRTARHVTDLVCISSFRRWDYHGPTHAGDVWEAEAFDKFWEHLYALEPYTLVFHNAPFDLGVLAKAFPDRVEALRRLVLEARVLDTEVLFKLRHPSHTRTSLAALAGRLLGRDLDKGVVRTSFRPGVPLSVEQREYALADAKATFDCFTRLQGTPLGGLVPREHEILVAAAGGHYNGRDPDVLFSTARALLAFDLEPAGIAVNQELLAEKKEELEREVSGLLGRLVEHDLARLKRKPHTETRELLPDGDPCEQVGRSWSHLRVNPPTLIRKVKQRLETVDAVVTLNEAALRGHYADFAAEHKIEHPVSDTGGLSMKYDFWKHYKKELPPPLQLHLELGRKRKYLSCFITPPHSCRATHVFPHYHIPGAETGRWACSGPNFMQLPKALRCLYRARPGRVFVYSDYKSLELYTLANSMAALGIKGPLMAALESGDDVHQLVASDLGATRDDSKACNFGLPGGMGLRRFFEQYGRDLGWDMAKASTLRNAWFTKFWDVAEYMELFRTNPYGLRPDDTDARTWLEALGFDPDATWPSHFELSRALQGGELFTCVLPSGRVIPRRQYAAAANIFFQGPGAEVITEAFIRCCDQRLPVVAVVHDSITLEVDEDDARHMGNRLTGSMQNALRAVCPDVPAPRTEYEISEVLL